MERKLQWSTEPTNFRGEENFVRTILEIAEKVPDTAYFTTGHGEKSPFDLDTNDGYSKWQNPRRQIPKFQQLI